MPTASFVSQVHPGIEETSNRKQFLDIEEVEVLEGLAQDPLVEIWGGEGERMQGLDPGSQAWGLREGRC